MMSLRRGLLADVVAPQQGSKTPNWSHIMHVLSQSVNADRRQTESIQEKKRLKQKKKKSMQYCIL